jgi:uncharacterized protein DUF1552
MTTFKTRVARRPFLAGLGSAAGAAALLRPLIAEADGAMPQRFLYVHQPCGTVSGLPGEGENASWFWYPQSGTGANYVPSPLLDLFRAVKGSILPIDGIDLGDVNQTTSGDKGAQSMMFMGTGYMTVAIDGFPLDQQFDPPQAKKITVPKGTKTIDQLLLDRIPALTQALAGAMTGPQFKSIQLAGTVKSMNGQGEACIKVLSYAGNNQPLWPEGRSDVAFNNIFGTAMMPGVDPAVIARLRAQKMSVLDSVIVDIQRMQALLPAGQRPKLDAQLTAIRALEARIGMTMPGALVKPMLIPEPTTGRPGANADEARHEALITNMLEIIRCAFASDLTRVASITFADCYNPLRPLYFCPNPGFAIASSAGGIQFGGKTNDLIEAKAEMAAFYDRLLAQALARMAQTPEGAGSLLDNVFGVFFTECRDGDTHERRRIPLMLFGGKFLKLQTGQFFAASPNRYVNDVWASALTAWGVPTTVFGDPVYGRGVISGLFG